MLAGLSALGITRGRWTRQDRVVALWMAVSASLLAVMAVDLAIVDGISPLVYGVALGYVAGVTLHTAHHVLEQTRNPAA